METHDICCGAAQHWAARTCHSAVHGIHGDAFLLRHELKCSPELAETEAALALGHHLTENEVSIRGGELPVMQATISAELCECPSVHVWPCATKHLECFLNTLNFLDASVTNFSLRVLRHSNH